MRFVLPLICAGFLGAASLAIAQPGGPPPSAAPAPSNASQPAPGTTFVFKPGIYGVIMRMELDKEGRVTSSDVTRVIPMAADVGGAVTGPLPDVFLKAVRDKLNKVQFKEQGVAYRFFVFNPAEPSRADIGPDPADQ